MAGASDPLEDMLFSEVDEKAVSDLVGSLESQLVGQSNPAASHTETSSAGSTGAANHHLGRIQPAQVGTVLDQQQQQGQHEAGLNQEPISKEISPEKTMIPSSLSSVPPFEEASITSGTRVNASSGLQSHGACNITTLSASGLVTLPHPMVSISPANRGTVLGSGRAATVTIETDPQKNHITSTIRTPSAGIQSLNGSDGAVTLVNCPTNTTVPTAVGGFQAGSGTLPMVNNVNTAAVSSAGAVNASLTVASSTNATTFNIAPTDFSASHSAINLDGRGTPTIALQRLPSHIMASIAQNGNGTTVSALVQQGARINPPAASAAPLVNHSTSAGASNPKSDSPVQSKIIVPSQASVVTSVTNPVSSSAAPVANPPSGQQQSSVASSLPVASSPAPLTAIAKPPATLGQQATTTVGIVRPGTPSPAPVVATSTQPQQLRSGLGAPQRIVAPQLLVRPPQQQTTIQLPPGFTIPQGMVLVRTEMGQLVMVPQQALAQAQAQAQAQNSISPRPATSTTTTTFRMTTTQKAPVTGGLAAMAVAVTTSQQQQQQPPPVVMAGGQSAPQAQPQPTPQPALPPQSAVPAASVVSQEMQENVKKCKNFLATLIKLASHNSPSPETSRNVKALVQDLLDAKIEPEEFTNRLQSELKSSPQPYLVPFLKKSLPALRLSLLNSQQSLTQPLQQAKLGLAAPPAATGTLPVTPAVRPRHPNSVSTTVAGVLPGVAHSHVAVPGIKRTGVQGGQVRMPMVITQTVRGVVGKGPSIQASRSPMGFAVQVSANQKNKLNDPGGGSFRDDDDINDVASMAGVNLNEESARILATNSDLVGTQIRSCRDEAFLPTGVLHKRILETAKKFGVTEVPMEAVNLISHATQTRLRTVLEKVSTIAQHRMETCKDDEWYEQSTDVRSQLKFFEQLERMEKQRKDEQEREILLKAAKSRSRQEDPEQARLKQKAKEMQQQELAQMRQRDANLTALAAIGPRKKRKLDWPGATPSGTEVSGTSAGSPVGTMAPLATSRQYPRHRITRVNLRDFIFYMEQDRETARSLLLYRALLK
ncbi:transcription initiation factor TFIID subunit 4-like [Megalops cyprinoides]|uniref:transcription initiation factor TFIID subunit 4-like n=1 Tax=Megalops cyprinoides TaxID=118141 RepID=UPI001864A045|nr:transcription initiation factor TFIID subunit 4-like [Megalops cyprinoides]